MSAMQCKNAAAQNEQVQIEENSFSQIVAHWNALPESVIDATSVNSFKNRLNNHWKNIEIKFVPDFYGPEAGISRNFQ